MDPPLLTGNVDNILINLLLNNYYVFSNKLAHINKDKKSD